MIYERFELPRVPLDQLPTVHRWRSEGKTPQAVAVIAHGMGEHALRYARFASALVEDRYIVYAPDHRGHGATVRSEAQLGDFGEAGWPGLVEDLRSVVERARTDHPDLPVLLFGHSMGSMAVQDLLTRASDLVAAAALSGTTAVDLMAASLVADDTVDTTTDTTTLEQVPDPTAEGSGAEPNVFEAMNAAFAPTRTDFDWLSRDEREVDRYIADPLCGFTVLASSTASLAESGLEFSKPERIARVRRDLPIYLLSGDRDPVGGNGALVELVAQRYREAGVERVESKLYADARHELLNETNRDEVTRDFLRWARRALA